MRKPTVAAWLANVLVRQRCQEVARVVELGAALRKAQAAFDGGTLRRLSRQRHDLVQGLIADAQHLAEMRGQKISDAATREVEQTIEAALFDADAAEQLQRGRLTGALEYSGIGFPAQPGLGRPSADSPTDRRAAGRRAKTNEGPQTRRERTRARDAGAGSELREAQHSARDARRGAELAATALGASELALERERTALSAAEAELARRRELTRSAQREVTRARTDRDAAERSARRAEEKLEGLRRGTP